MSCPEVAALREFAELGPAGDMGAVAAHVASCPRCARLVELARAEEAAIRAALPVNPPRDLLARTLASIEPAEGRTKSRRQRALPHGTRISPVFAVFLAALALVAAIVIARQVFTTEAPDQAPQPPGLPGPVPTSPPSLPAPAPAPSPLPVPPEPRHELLPPPAPPSPPAPAPAPLVPGHEPPAPPPPPSPEPVTAQKEPAHTEAPALALVRSGKLRAGGKALAAGDAIPAGAAIEVGTTSEVEAPEVASVVLAAGSKLTVRAGDAGEPVIALAQGKLYARSLGEKPYAVEGPDAHATPLGTAFLVSVEGGTTRVGTIEGRVSLAVPRASSVVLVRAGFAVEVAKGKDPTAPVPFDAASAVSWLPAAARPKSFPATPRILRNFSRDGEAQAFTAGERLPDGERGFVRGVPADSDYAVHVDVEDPKGVLTVDPDLWIEATIKVDRKTRVALQVWDFDRKVNLAHIVTVEANVWVTIAAPLRDFTDSSGQPLTSPPGKGDRGTNLSVFAGNAGEPLTLVVESMRLSQ